MDQHHNFPLNPWIFQPSNKTRQLSYTTVFYQRNTLLSSTFSVEKNFYTRLPKLPWDYLLHQNLQNSYRSGVLFSIDFDITFYAFSNLTFNYMVITKHDLIYFGSNWQISHKFGFEVFQKKFILIRIICFYIVDIICQNF